MAHRNPSTEPDAPSYQHARGSSNLLGDFSWCALVGENEGNYTREAEKNPWFRQFDPTPDDRESHVEVFNGERAYRIRSATSFLPIRKCDDTRWGGLPALRIYIRQSDRHLSKCSRLNFCSGLGTKCLGTTLLLQRSLHRDAFVLKGTCVPIL